MHKCIIHSPFQCIFFPLISKKVCNVSDFLFIILTQAGLVAIKLTTISYSYSRVVIQEHCTKLVLESVMTIRSNHTFCLAKNSEYCALLIMVKNYFLWESYLVFFVCLSVAYSTRDWLAKIKRDDGRTLNGPLYRYQLVRLTFLYM